MWTTVRIRKHFLEYFRNHDHSLIASSSLIPHHDPSLLFTTAGMVPFKNVFTGIEKKPYRRAVTIQKCMRAGGKHNDLENVGYTPRHHTFFEMLGNFSFGDYFKEESILFAWNLITKDFEIPSDKLVVTVYAQDEEAAHLWRHIAGLSDDKIIRISSADNFWSMGDTGPCGPCSEIFYDHGSHIKGGPPGSPDEDGNRFVEIWNLVFMQYDQRPNERCLLPRPSIDTGMGLERLAAVLQGVTDNYDIDLFKTLIQASVEETGIQAEGKALNSHRVIADHLRASAFLVADGILPSNEGRGYVLRRIMRRAMRHSYLLGVKEPLLHRLVPTLISEMGEAYPELNRAHLLISESLQLEEERFRQTLGRGLKLLKDETDKLTSQQALSGEVAFKLYDTYGFPLDLTQDILRAEGRAVDQVAFEKAMTAQKLQARASWAGSGEKQNESLWFQIREEKGSTEFLGYDTLEAEALLQAIIIDNVLYQTAEPGQTVDLIFNQTPFYAEAGGQMGDIGLITGESGIEIKIKSTLKKIGALHIHRGYLRQGVLRTSQILTLKVDGYNRAYLKAHHSATHLLHAVLQRTLEGQVVQKGSLVAKERLRFDFSYNYPLSPEMLCKIESSVNALIRLNTETTTRLMTYQAALDAGAMALFGEKYSEEVRVVSIGHELKEGGSSSYSIELCGGTHVTRTGDIGYFKIMSESGIAAGVRRIEAVTGAFAEAYVKAQETVLHTLAQALKTRPEELMHRLEILQEDRRRLEKELKALKISKTHQSSDCQAPIPKIIQGIPFLKGAFEGLTVQDLKSLVDNYKKQLGSAVIVLGTITEGKGSMIVAVTSDLTARFNAVEGVKIAAPLLGGKGGGGRADMAQTGGPEGHRLEEAFQAIEKMLEKIPLS